MEDRTKVARLYVGEAWDKLSGEDKRQLTAELQAIEQRIRSLDSYKKGGLDFEYPSLGETPAAEDVP